MINSKEAQKRTEAVYHERFGIDLDRLIKDRSDEGHRTCSYRVDTDRMDYLMYKGFIDYLEAHGYDVHGKYDPNFEITFDLKW